MAGVYLAYEGTIQGDWLAQYALRLAANAVSRELCVLHARRPDESAADGETRLAAIHAQCRHAGIAAETRSLPHTPDLMPELCRQVPAGPQSLLVCGLGRMQGGSGRASLAAALFQARHCRVLGLHIAKPAPRGLPGRILLPVGGHPYGLRAASAWLQLLRPEVTHLQVLLVRQMGRQRLARAHRRDEPLHSGQAYCDRIEGELRDRLHYGARVSESLAVVATDVAEAILVAAHRFAAGLILLGASQQSFYGRLVRGSPIGAVVRKASCDVGVCGGWL